MVILTGQGQCYPGRVASWYFSSKVDTKQNEKLLHSTTISLVPRKLPVGEGREDSLAKMSSYLLIIILYSYQF